MIHDTPQYLLYVMGAILSIAVLYLITVLHRRTTRPNEHYVYHLGERLSSSEMDRLSLDYQINQIIEHHNYDLKRFVPTALFPHRCVVRSLPIIHERLLSRSYPVAAINGAVVHTTSSLHECLFGTSSLVAVIFEGVPIYSTSDGCIPYFVAAVPLYVDHSPMVAILQPKTSIPCDGSTVVIRNKYDIQIFRRILKAIAGIQDVYVAQANVAFFREVFMVIYMIRKEFCSISRIHFTNNGDFAILLEGIAWDRDRLVGVLKPYFGNSTFKFNIKREPNRLIGTPVTLYFHKASQD